MFAGELNSQVRELPIRRCVPNAHVRFLDDLAGAEIPQSNVISTRAASLVSGYMWCPSVVDVEQGALEVLFEAQFRHYVVAKLCLLYC